MARNAKKAVAKSTTTTAKRRATGQGRASSQGRTPVVAAKSVKSSTKNYVVTSPGGSQVILENKGLTTNQAKQMALPILRREESNASLVRNDLSAKQVPVFNL